MSQVDLGSLLESSGAILRGHFVLTSGRHSDVYFEKFRVLERPDVLSALCAEIAVRFGEGRRSKDEGRSDEPTDGQGNTGTEGRRDEETENANPSGLRPTDHESRATCPDSADSTFNLQPSTLDLVAGPTTGGIIIAFEVARQMGLPSIYVESEGGVRKLRRNAKIAPGARVLVVDDVLTTGKSVFETMEVVRQAGGVVAGVAVLIDRTEKPLNFGCPFFSSYRVSATSYPPNEIPDWLAAIPAVKPGSSGP